MKTINQNIVIPFTGLKDEIHNFEFHLEDKFFEQFEFSEVKKGKLDLKIELDKKPQFLMLQIQIKGSVDVLCDRCLDNFDLSISYSDFLCVKFGEKFDQEENNLMIIPPSEDQLNLNHYIYECICLSIPYKRIHPKDKNGKSMCNEEMLKKIEEHNIKEKEEIIDSRWEQLKKLKKSN